MRYSKFDLHCHSLKSDGSLSPAEVVERAKANGVETLSLTDHDTIAGLAEARVVAEEVDLNLVSGIEISSIWGKHGIHILAYNFGFECAVMTQVQEQQSKLRVERAKQICERLQKQGLPETYELARSKSQEGIPGRPHFADSMVELGVVDSVNDAFKKYLGSGKAGDVKNIWPNLEQVMGWIKEANAVAVIAHPRKYDFSLTKLRALIAEFIDLGGEGIEVVVSGQKPGEVGMLSDLCRRYGLLGSVGSDFHSPKWSWAELGRVQPLPESIKPIWSAWT